MAVASAGPYANNLPLAPEDNHTDTSSLNFYRPDALPDAQPLKAVFNYCISYKRKTVTV